MRPQIEADVILVAHGAGDASPANRSVVAVARRAAAQLRGVQVTVAFLRGTPSLADAIAQATAARCAIVPLLASEGYFHDRIREEVLRVARSRPGGPRLTLLRPVGNHRRVRTSLAYDVARVIGAREWPPARVTVVVLGHGTERSPASAGSARAAARAIGSLTGARVVTAFLDQRPSVEAGIAALDSGRPVVIVPFLFGGGPHALDDVPARVRATLPASGVPVENVAWLEPLSEQRWLGAVVRDVIQRFLRQAVPLRAGARGSELSKRQVALAAERLRAAGLSLVHVPIDTPGDRDQSTPLDALGDDAVFSADIDAALLAGTIDVAIHSLKDLPLATPPGIVNAAILPRASVDDVLVTRDRTGLRDLPGGAVVGTSSSRRANQLLRLRPDLVTRPVRGAVPHRIEQLQRGDYDALVLAAAGLERLGLGHVIGERFSAESMLPAPGQGAIVIQCREDSPFRRALVRLSDGQTELAVEAELRFAAEIGRVPGYTAAAHATPHGHGIRLHARAIHLASGQVADATATGDDPQSVGAEAARIALSALRALEPVPVECAP